MEGETELEGWGRKIERVIKNRGGEDHCVERGREKQLGRKRHK